ncbi:hypothetical protein BpHYR1_011510 [Brachionus plicatilis]|uniref:Uncharacterized protein n=1 Tax=Brachionus plicatilis TaxID=10195 RepID=A0A3M7S505_BRAPC|nr:hypothetical protein BpHYR1_011510 [Brachionus plicatilis]
MLRLCFVIKVIVFKSQAQDLNKIRVNFTKKYYNEIIATNEQARKIKRRAEGCSSSPIKKLKGTYSHPLKKNKHYKAKKASIYIKLKTLLRNIKRLNVIFGPAPLMK